MELSSGIIPFGDELSQWWAALTSKWNWEDPILLLTFLTVLVTALIPVFLWRLGAKQATSDSEVRRLQAESLTRQERIASRQRRDNLLDVIGSSSDETHLRLLWAEIRDFDGEDGGLLRSAYRSNASVSLPGSSAGGIQIESEPNDKAVADYVAGLERKYASGERGFHAYSGLLDFLHHARTSQRKLDDDEIVKLVTGESVSVQRPGHEFYRRLVNVFPEAAAGLLRQFEKMDKTNSDGSRLNVLTGALLGIKDAEMDRISDKGAPVDEARRILRKEVPSSLASFLHRENLRSLKHWSLAGSTEPVSATVAWLIRAVGWLVDEDDHSAMRMVQNLPDVIRSIPITDRSWGIDKRDVRDGFQAIMKKCPELWSIYGHDLEAAANEISPWRKD